MTTQSSVTKPALLSPPQLQAATRNATAEQLVAAPSKSRSNARSAAPSPRISAAAARDHDSSATRSMLPCSSSQFRIRASLQHTHLLPCHPSLQPAQGTDATEEEPVIAIASAGTCRLCSVAAQGCVQHLPTTHLERSLDLLTCSWPPRIDSQPIRRR